MPYNYSYNDSPMTPNVETISRLPRRVQMNPPMPPTNPNFTPLSDMATQPTPVAAPQAQTQGSPNGILDVLRALFSGLAGGQPQGMTGLMQPGGQRAPGTDTLGNPVGRF